MTGYLLTSFIGAILGIALFYSLASSWASWQLNRRLRRGLRMEAKGEKILKREGYDVLSTQEKMEVTMLIDGKAHTYKICPDGFARKGGILYAVEIKSGTAAPNPFFKDTRRQVLEYYYQFPVEGVLLVNADDGDIKLIQFIPSSKRPSSRSFKRAFKRFLFLLIPALLLGYFLHYKGFI